MKQYNRHILSALLAVALLLGMIPVGTFSAGALNDSKSEFWIANLKDWNDVASSNSDFAGKTVHLSGNLDAGGAQLVTLFENFAGTFDGHGYTISNFTATGALLAEKTLSGAVIKNLTVQGMVKNEDEGVLATGMLVAQHDDPSAGTLSVSDVTVKGLVISDAQQVGGVFGVLTLRDGQSAKLQRITVEAQVVNNRKDLTHACISAGGVVGIFEPIGAPNLTVREIRMTGEVYGKTSVVGGVLGSVFSADHMEDLYAGGTIKISNCLVAGKIISESELYVQGTGGIIGSFGGFKFHYGDLSAYNGELEIEHCDIRSRIENFSAQTHAVAVGGVIGAMSYHHSVVNVNHCLIAPSFPSNSLTATDGSGSALILGTGAFQRLSSINVNNTVTTYEQFALIGSMVGHEKGHSPQLMLNGKNYQSVATPYSLYHWRYSGAISDDSVITVSSTVASNMVKTDDDGFVTRVTGMISMLGVQDNVTSPRSAGETYAVRLIAVTPTAELSDATINVVAYETATGKAIKSFTAEDTKLYDGLSAYDHGGNKIRAYRATEFGAEKFLALIIQNIPAGVAYTFEVTPEYTTEDGVRICGERVTICYGANGQYVSSSRELSMAPKTTTVRVMSSNILIADARGYHLDDIHNATGEVYDPSKDDGRDSTVIYKDGLNYYWYFRDDQTGEHFGRENGQPGYSNEQRVQYMAEMYAAYQPDFIGLQEVYGGTVINWTPTINMQQTLLSYLGDRYAYVDFTDKVPTDAQYNPILYRVDKWRVVAKDIADDQWSEYANEMHRWQWALFESLENPNERFIVLNLHGPNNLAGADLKDFQPTFFASVNAQLKMLEQAYPDVPIAVTGDYNQTLSSSMISTMLSGTSLINTETQTKNFELSASTIDHIFITGNLVTVEQMRVADNKTLTKSSDHWAIFSDFILKKQS